MTTIYQIHEYYENGNRIVGSYFDKEKAIKKKIEFEQEYAEKIKCNSCPLYFCYGECGNDCENCKENSMKITKRYCKRFNPVVNQEAKEIRCSNKFLIFNESIFVIQEAVVE